LCGIFAVFVFADMSPHHVSVRALFLSVLLSLSAAQYTFYPADVGTQTTVSIAAGGCAILNFSATATDSLFYDDDTNPDGVDDGKIKNSALEYTVSSTSSGDLEYFALLVPESYVYVVTDDDDGSTLHDGYPLYNNPNDIFWLNSSCWAEYDDVGTSGLYSNSISSNGKTQIVYDMSSKSEATKTVNEDSCRVYIGIYYLVLRASVATDVTVDIELVKEKSCKVNAAAIAAALLIWCICCAVCCCGIPILGCICFCIFMIAKATCLAQPQPSYAQQNNAQQNTNLEMGVQPVQVVNATSGTNMDPNYTKTNDVPVAQGVVVTGTVM
jgi:hypothetical protein